MNASVFVTDVVAPTFLPRREGSFPEGKEGEKEKKKKKEKEVCMIGKLVHVCHMLKVFTHTHIPKNEINYIPIPKVSPKRGKRKSKIKKKKEKRKTKVRKKKG